MIRKAKLFLLIFFIFFFINNEENLAGVYSDKERPLTQEEQREKALGLSRKDINAENITQQDFLRDIDMGNIDDIKLFLKNSKNQIDFVINGVSPLPHAATINNIEIIKIFVNETEININIQDENGNTALINASGKGNLEIADYLINNGADINHQNKSGLTAIMNAAEKNKFYAIKLLLSNNADVSKSDYTGRTLREIAEDSRDKRILKLLN